MEGRVAPRYIIDLLFDLADICTRGVLTSCSSSGVFMPTEPILKSPQEAKIELLCNLPHISLGSLSGRFSLLDFLIVFMCRKKLKSQSSFQKWKGAKLGRQAVETPVPPHKFPNPGAVRDRRIQRIWCDGGGRLVDTNTQLYRSSALSTPSIALIA